MDVLKELQTAMNFTTILSKGNNSWSAMIHLVHQQKMDFAATGFSQTFKRQSLVDFSMPLTTTFLRIFYAKDNEGVNWLLYVNSYHHETWLCAIISAILSFGIFAIIARLTRNIEMERQFSTWMALSFTILSQESPLKQPISKQN